MKHLELEFIHQEQTPKEGINHLDEISVGERSNFKKFPTHTQDHGDAHQ